VHPRHRGVGISFRLPAVATADRETGSDLSADGPTRHLTRWSAGHASPRLEVRFRRTGPDRSQPQHTPPGRPTGWSRVWSRAVHRTYRGAFSPRRRGSLISADHVPGRPFLYPTINLSRLHAPPKEDLLFRLQARGHHSVGRDVGRSKPQNRPSIFFQPGGIVISDDSDVVALTE
jgi:hypothetical protein